MRTPGVLATAYDASPVAVARAGLLSELRAALPRVAAANYRGIGRYPLNADYDYANPGWQWDKIQRHARAQLGTLAVAEALDLKKGVWREEDWLMDGPWLLPSLASAAHVASFLDDKAEYELVEVARYPSRTAAPALGFDVGWWASGNFSILCDAVLWPIWHPPSTAAVPILAESLHALNEAVLFPDVASALRYREVYRQQEWAENDDPPFEIIEVAPVGAA